MDLFPEIIAKNSKNLLKKESMDDSSVERGAGYKTKKTDIISILTMSKRE
jgi:hypothetical protein